MKTAKLSEIQKSKKSKGLHGYGKICIDCTRRDICGKFSCAYLERCAYGGPYPFDNEKEVEKTAPQNKSEEWKKYSRFWHRNKNSNWVDELWNQLLPLVEGEIIHKKDDQFQYKD